MNTLNYRTGRYSVEIEVDTKLTDVFHCLTHRVAEFWPENFAGSSNKLHDEFVFTSEGGHYSRNRVVELVPDRKIVWLVTESVRKTDNFEWTGTRMTFELSPRNGKTGVKFTYAGPVLENERERLAQICDFVIKDRLHKLLAANG